MNNEQNKAFASMRKGRQVLKAAQGVEDIGMKAIKNESGVIVGIVGKSGSDSPNIFNIC